jgi:DNA helicase HerA-like ATPase
MFEDGKIFIGASFNAEGARVRGEYLELRLANRHGLVTGATGTGKTVTLQALAEGFSDAGVSVFAADIKGDLSGIAAQGEPKDFLLKRAREIGLDPYVNDRFPTVFWDLFGEQGHPIRATVSEMGPLLLARLMNLNDTQEGVLNIVFRVADEQGLLILDLKDLQALLGYVAENAATLTTRFGNVAKATVGAVQRQLLVLEAQGGNRFFGEPALELADLMRTARDGRGVVNILAADKLMQSPRLYATFLLWLLSELFEQLPEVGDPDKPKLVFFFDEAHLLFDEAPRALVEKVQQVVRLIRSKGVGVYFVTQNPIDVPEEVAGQLGNRVQHALRAFTPREQKAVRAAAETFRPNPELKTAQVITELGVGEALVSMLEPKGVPSIVQRTLIRPPSARIGPLTAEERAALIRNSPVAGRYDQTVDRDSAYEMLARKAQDTAAAAEAAKNAPDETSAGGGLGGVLGTIFGTGSGRGKTLTPGQTIARDVTRTVVNQTAGEIAARIGKSVAGSVGGSVGRAVVRGVLGSLLRR